VQIAELRFAPIVVRIVAANRFVRCAVITTDGNVREEADTE
jgi:hypothetical protein